MTSDDTVMKDDMEADSLISDGLAAVIEGCRLPVRMKNPANGVEEWPKAEVIAIKAMEAGLSQYYVHYVDYNKRLDEWVSEDR
jgi:histone acetyltransferase HTATIP